MTTFSYNSESKVDFETAFRIVRMIQYGLDTSEVSWFRPETWADFAMGFKKHKIWYQARNTRLGKDNGTAYAVREDGRYVLIWKKGGPKHLHKVGWFKAMLLRRGIMMRPAGVPQNTGWIE